MYACLWVGYELFEWHQYTFYMETWHGRTAYSAYRDTSSQDSMTDQPSLMRIYDEVDFTFGASIGHNSNSLDEDYFYKGF